MLNLETVKTIAYLGPQASFTEMAKDEFCKRFNISAYPTPLQTIRQVVEYVDDTPDSLGVLAVENSIEGAVRESMDNLAKICIALGRTLDNVVEISADTAAGEKASGTE